MPVGFKSSLSHPTNNRAVMLMDKPNRYFSRMSDKFKKLPY
jgi:hypothetical protein